MRESGIISTICLFLMLTTGCSPKNNAHGDVSEIKVSSGDQAFSVEELKSAPGEEVSFKLFNGLKKEKLRFYLLRNGEDPIVVQHIKAQQGSVPPEYYLFKSNDIDPNTGLDLSFKAPSKEGVYSFVGVSDSPKETMVGRLIVAKVVLKKEDQDLEKGLN